MYPSRFRYEAPRSLGEAISLLTEGGDEAKVLAGRPEPGTADEAALRVAGTDRRHQQHRRSRLPPRGRGRHAPHRRAVPPRRPGTLGPAQRHPADHGRGRAADRRPDRAQPRHAGRLALPRRPAGRLGLGGDGARRLGDRAGAERPARPSRWRSFVTGPFENALEPDEIAVEAVIPPAQGTRSGGYLKLERRVGDFATVGVAVALETSGGTVTAGGNRPDRVGGSTIAATDAAERPGRAGR